MISYVHQVLIYFKWFQSFWGLDAREMLRLAERGIDSTRKVGEVVGLGLSKGLFFFFKFKARRQHQTAFRQLQHP